MSGSYAPGGSSEGADRDAAVTSGDGGSGVAASYEGPYASQARFDGCVTVVAYPRPTIAALLPQELALPEAPPAAEGLHPVLFLLGRLAEGSVILAGTPVPSRFEYEELMIAVPFVHHRSGPGPSIWSAVMVCTSTWATWSGNFFYALSKRTGRLSWNGPDFEAGDAEGRDLLRGRVEPAGPPLTDPGVIVRGAGSPLSFATSLPVCGRRPNGEWAASRFHWDLEHASAFPARVVIEALDSGLGFDRAPRAGERGSSFWIEGMLWRISPPARVGG